MEIFNNRKIIKIEDLKKIRQENQSIVFCSGCYDILQPGHVCFFKQCKQFGNVLVVDVGSDKAIRQLKSSNRPLNCQENRVYLVASIENVDFAIIGGDQVLPGKIEFKDIIEQLRPDVFVLNDDDSAIEEKRVLCNKLGIRLELVPRIVPDYLKPSSSTKIIESLKQ